MTVSVGENRVRKAGKFLLKKRVKESGDFLKLFFARYPVSTTTTKNKIYKPYLKTRKF